MSTKKEFLNNLVGNQIYITKIISWSLASVPDDLLTSDTMVLLPSISSDAYINRAITIGYPPENIMKSYDRCQNLKLFDVNITKAVIFLSNNQCVISDYLPDKNGDDSPVVVIDNNSTEYNEIIKYFDDTWNN